MAAALWQMPKMGFVGRNANSPQQYGQVTLPQANASGIIQIPRSMNQGSAISGAWGQNTANRAQANQTITDFTKNYLQQGPQLKSFANQETGAIGRFYGSGPGSVAGDLAAIERRRSNAVTQAAESAIRRAARANSIRRMGSGNNSANDHWYVQQVGNIAAQTAADRAQNDSANYRYVADSQRGLAGQRQKLLNDLTMRDLTPLDVSQRYEANSLSNLGTLGTLEDRNTIYDDTALRRQLLQNLMLN